jgi:hypothetical protein
VKIKKQNPYTWCNGLYLSAGTYKDNYSLKEDTPVEFISSSIVKLKGLPITIRRELLSTDDPANSNLLNKRIDFMVSAGQYEYLSRKSKQLNRSVSDTLRFLILVAYMEDYAGTEEAKNDSRFFNKTEKP